MNAPTPLLPRAFCQTCKRKHPKRRARQYTAYVAVTALLLAVCGPVVAAVFQVFTR